VIAVVVTAAQAAIWVSNLPEFLLALVVVLFTAAAEGGSAGLRVAIACAVALTALTAVGLGIAQDVSVYQVPLVALTCGAAIGLGVGTARQRDVAAALAARVTAARMEGAHRQREAVAEERTAIARELHDIIGHALATIAVRAEAADRVAATKPEAATEAIASIAVAARQSLDETRRVLAGLRQADVAELEPAPDLDAIRQLIAGLQEAGATIDYREAGCDGPEPSAVVLGGTYRIVQESLSNAIKHAGPGTEVQVEITCRSDALEVQVVNSLAERDDAEFSDETAPWPGDGQGLSGMAERAQVLGGRFEAGPQGDRFVVRALLPTAGAGRSPNQREEGL
jgi:signal transduction histidine kinase